MKLIKIVSLVVVLVCGTLAQSNPLVKKTISVEAVGYRSYIATWYCLKGRTASGALVSNGIVAVDPRIIPLGSKIAILGRGIFTALDTGSSIKGNRLDLWTTSCREAIKLGRQNVKVRVISRPNKKST